MQEETRSLEQLLLKIARLEQEVTDLKQSKTDLEILLETTVSHADTIAALLQESNQKLQAEVAERQRTEAELRASRADLQVLLIKTNRDKADLEILLETTAQHGDLVAAHLDHQSIHDPLTGLFNRRRLEKFLKQEIQRASRNQRSMGLIMSDIDYLKRFNDTFGHEAGNVVLREVGLFLRKSVGNSDIACRYGGEEFMLILPNASLEDTHQRAEQLREGVKQLQLQHLEQPLTTVTMSLGIACFPQHGRTGPEIIRAADAALYQAKRTGRDRVIAAT